MRRPRPASPSFAVAVLSILLAGAPAFGAAGDPVAPERRAAWERERQRAQAVAELLVRQEWVRRQGNSAAASAPGGAANAVASAPPVSTPGADAGLAELFRDDEPRAAETLEAAPLLPVTIPAPVPSAFPVAPAPPPLAVPVVPLLTPPTAPAPIGVELFHLGYSRYSQGDWAGAREAFAAFMTAHPAHDLTDNAAFWLAECAAQDGPADVALAQFQQVARDYPGGDKAPDAQVRIAALQGRIGRSDEARRVLEGVVRDWPGTAAARRASELLAATPPAAR